MLVDRCIQNVIFFTQFVVAHYWIRFLFSKLSKFCGEELVIVNQSHDPLGLYISLDYTMPWILELPKQCMILR